MRCTRRRFPRSRCARISGLAAPSALSFGSSSGPSPSLAIASAIWLAQRIWVSTSTTAEWCKLARAIAIELGQWLAFQLSVWHEIATWFGWSSMSAFPEKVSSFSPEDLYSNLIGVRIAAAIASQRTARDESLYNRSVDEWLDRILSHLGAVPADVGSEAMRSVDGLWWDSTARLPDPRLVLRRNMGVGAVVTPWLVPPDRMGPALVEQCGSQPKALPMANPERLAGPDFSDRASLLIELSEELAHQEPFRSLGGRITERDFPAILKAIRAQNRAEFGAGADRPG